jgi:protease-4
MFTYIFYGIRNLFRLLGNLFRRLGKAPDYVMFTLEGEYPEVWDPPGNFIERRLRPPRISLQEIAEQFRTIAEDRRVSGVILHLRQLEMDQARLESLRDLIIELRQSGKRVIAWATRYFPATYFVACAADEILLQPGGNIAPIGLRRTYPYLAESLERVGVKGDFIQISPYKSAYDIIMRKDMSDEVREMSNWLIDSAFKQVIAAISLGRGISEQQAKELLDSTPCTDLKAIEKGIVDKTISEEDLSEYLQQDDKPAKLATWEEAKSRLFRRPLPRLGRYVALLTIEGAIIDGESSRPPIKPPIPIPMLMEPRAGDLSVVQAARKALKDRRAAAVVCYVDSGGGSATSSEAMRAALEKIDNEKPLIVSMGGVAGSGGYWVSTPGRHIMAQPGTITGSIGVLMGKIILGELLDRLLFGRETLSRGKNILIDDVEDPFSQEEREIIWDTINRTYDHFLELVSEKRKKSREDVDAIGKGRVWTGEQALENGLVDELGGLDRALSKAREMAGLHERAPVRMILPDKKAIPPVATPANVLDYALEGAQMFRWGTPLLLCPILWDMQVEGF